MDFLPFTRPSLDEQTIAEVGDVLRSGWLTSGPKVQAFEAQLSALMNGRVVRSLNSGTAALEIALRLIDIQPGDEVITTPLSWVATANVVVLAGAKPVFVDIDPVTRNIDLDRIEAAITPRTRAVIAVDLAGLPVDRDRLYTIAKQYNLRIIEDAAQSFGATWKGRAIGSFGDLVAFSFHANKNITTGEGGCLVLPDASLTGLCEKLRLQGVVRQPDGSMEVDVAGGKFNLTDIAAAIGLGQLRHLDAFTARRRELARHYFDHFDRNFGCELPPANFTDSNWHMFQIVLPLERMSIARGEFIARMKARDIGIGVHYPPIHLFQLYRELGFSAGQFPHAERVGAGIATLPLFPAMTEADVERVCAACAEVLNEVMQ
ncbi:UDP-4-amino-4-deoxy-L-arabinose--oxoglutarate aminotransferase [Sulfuriferula multivorans]|uniref:UDP-4-amino-4-deoxy-L-arabinose--oxoglutarate aminotransferase n=1 Tax=Sulfuriferula multivorans TaxID=1559896 RepID=A0A401JF02_9PROT|nr:DegT/DnrJ/EryC1/StrS aminotransferase family protein [Sulfuriferula multivorans]GBL46200.1 UDP-4-amino-4-deoxy-L-arabinose--oxoglutarate aminotransferase [Sulfuriferula multivorans]